MAKASFATVLKSWFSASDGSSQQIARIASFIVTLVGCLVFIGWSLNIPILRSPILGAATMKANTALCFILAGISLGLQTRHRQNRRTVRIAKGCAIAVSTIAFLTLCQYLFSWNLGIDQLLVQDPLTLDTSYPGRMGDNTALNFALTGLALWLRGQKTRRSDFVAQSATLCVAAIALLSVVGYAYNVQVFHRFIFYSTSMAFHTALTFLVLCGGILASRTDYGLWKIFTGELAGSIVARRLIPIAIAVPLGLGWLVLHGLTLKLYDTAFCLALLVFSLILTFTIVILRNARSLNQVDYDRRRSDERLRSSEERYQRLAANIPGVLYQYVIHSDGSHGFLYVSPKSKELYEPTIEELQNGDRYMEQRLHPEDAEQVHAAGIAAAQHLSLFNLEFRLLMPSGQIKWIQATSHPTRQENGDVVFDGLMTDISDRKQTQLDEQFLSELDLRLRQLSDVDAMAWEVVNCLGEYLNVDRCMWNEIDNAANLAIVKQDWYQRKDMPSVVGVYKLSDFALPDLIELYHQGQTVVVADVTTHPYTSSFVENYIPYDTSAYVAVPCVIERNWVAMLVVNARTARNWRSDEVALLQEVVRRLWAIIEQTRAIQALREQEERLRLALQAANQGFYDLNVQTGKTIVSLEYAQMLGYDLETLQETNAKWRERLHPDDWEPVSRVYEEYIAGDRSEYYVEFRQQTRSGEWKWILSLGKIVAWDAEGNPLRMLGTHTDISDRKQAEVALWESERKFSAIFNQTFELIGLLSLDGILLEVNQSALDSINAQQNELVGKWFWETPWWTHSVQLQAQLKDAIDQAARGELIRYEVQFPSGSDHTMITDFSLKPIFDKSGQVVTLIAEGRDITDRKQAEIALQERNQELDAFVHIVSHDLKAPLRAISNLSQWIEEDLEGILSADSQQQMALLRSRVQRMEAMIDGLLNYARIGRMDDMIEPTAVEELLSEVIDSLNPPPSFSITIAPGLPTFNTKRLLLSQVFANLIGNSIKHHDRPEGSIRISGQDQDNFYEFAIVDDGPGIAPEYHDKIFTIFQSGKPKSRQDTSGIGLSIVKKIIESEKGMIRLESELVKGTTFYVTWPKKEE
jgi:PAS domain S-box-containing protein